MENIYIGTMWKMEMTPPPPNDYDLYFLFSENDLYYFSKQNYI